MRILRRAFLILFVCVGGCTARDPAQDVEPIGTVDRNVLRVSQSGRYLTYQDGDPFFWLADTAWTLVGLTRPEIELYFQDRSSKCFNVIQINTLAYFWSHLGFRVGPPPFLNDNPDTPNEPFWSELDWIVARAEKFGLHIALTLGWGEHYPMLFGEDIAKATRFGRWVGARYRHRSNIIWWVAGEYDLNNKSPWSIYDAVARGLIAGDRNHLITIHPAIPIGTQSGVQSSSVHWHYRPWLSFNILQSGHVDDRRSAGLMENYQMIQHDYRRLPTKPVIDAEPAYEDMIDGRFLGWNSPARIGPDAVRRKAYWAVFAGAAGHTYGHNDVFSFLRIGDGTDGGARHEWIDSLQAPAATQMRHLKTLMEGRSFDRIPDQTLLASDSGGGRTHVRASRAMNRRDAVVYIPTGNSVKINMGDLAGTAIASWFSPRDGTVIEIGRFPNRESLTFDPPGNPAVGNDWVLALDVE